MGHVMDVQFDADTQRIWALCDNTCGVVSTLLKVGTTGAIVPDVAYSKPAGLPVDNLEGFALAPKSTCVDGTKEAVWSDDGIYGTGTGSATEGHALYSGRVDCDLRLGSQGVPKPVAWDSKKVYFSGDSVSYDGSVYQALWYTSGEAPGSKKNGAWSQLAIAADGHTLWTVTRPFSTGDVVVYQNRVFTALWYTRGTTPGGAGGPWSEIVTPSTPGGIPAWSSATVYTGGEKVTYQGHTYQAQWYSTGTPPPHQKQRLETPLLKRNPARDAPAISSEAPPERRSAGAFPVLYREASRPRHPQRTSVRPRRCLACARSWCTSCSRSTGWRRIRTSSSPTGTTRWTRSSAR